jgi:hypothetical protein
MEEIVRTLYDAGLKQSAIGEGRLIRIRDPWDVLRHNV